MSKHTNAELILWLQRSRELIRETVGCVALASVEDAIDHASRVIEAADKRIAELVEQFNDACLMRDHYQNLWLDAGKRIVELTEQQDALKQQEPELSNIRGFALWLDREEWGHVIDGLILERDRSDNRKKANSESHSNVIADKCGKLISKITALAADIHSAPVPAELSEEEKNLHEGQWWLLELDAAVNTDEQKRAVAVVRSLLWQLLALQNHVVTTAQQTAQPASSDKRDAGRLEFLESNRNLTVEFECEEGGDDCWHVYKVVGSTNDREWLKVASGQTIRAVIDSVRAGMQQAGKDGEA